MENLYSYLTANHRSAHSVPVRWLKQNGLLKGRILDYGCGHGFDTIQLSEDGYECEAYDPHFQPVMPAGLFDTIICIYVLSVLEPEYDKPLLEDLQRRLKEDGNAYIAVLHVFKQEGWHMHKLGKMVYTRNVKLDLPIIRKTHKFSIYHLKKSTEIT